MPACFALLLGAVFLVLGCIEVIPGPTLFRISGGLFGAGGALAFVCWEQSFARYGIPIACQSILAASLLAVVPYLGLVFLARDVMVYPLACLLVPTCVLLLILSRVLDSKPAGASVDDAASRFAKTGEGMTSASHHVVETSYSGPSDWRHFLADAGAPLACVMMIGVVGPAVGSFASLGGMSDSLRAVLYQLASIAAIATLAVLWFRLRVRPTITGAFLVLVPVLAVAIFLFPFWSNGYQGFFLALGCYVFSLVSILMMVFCIELSECHDMSISVIYGLFAGGTYAAQVLGGALADVVASSSFPRQFQVVAVAALLVWGLSAIALVLMRRGANGLGHETSEPAVHMTTEVPASDPLSARCEELGSLYGLSPRELQVLELIGRGRDVGAIAEMLCLSRNTVRSHVSRLYSDLGVHNRQELIDLIDQSSDGRRAESNKL